MATKVSVIAKDADWYWELLKDLGDETKIKLIARLSSSLIGVDKKEKEGVKEDEADVDRLFGAWKGEESTEVRGYSDREMA